MELPRRTCRTSRPRTRAAWPCTRRRTAPTPCWRRATCSAASPRRLIPIRRRRGASRTGRLEVDAPPAAAVLGTTYFYGDAGMLYAVHNVHTDAAVFETTGFDFRDELVRDVAPVSSYLVGVADGAASLIVVKADFTGHAALSLENALPGVAFDAAFAFDEGVYVAGSDGTLYNVDVDLTTIDDNCWADSGEDAPARAATATPVPRRRRGRDGPARTAPARST